MRKLVTSLTPESSRAARAILKWSIRRSASKAGIAASTVYTLERGRSISDTSKAKIIRAFNAHGVTVLAGGAQRVEPT